MPTRLLREGILTSDRVNLLDPPGEVFYRRLMSVVDDFGRFDGRPVMLKSRCFPLRVDTIREADISRWIAMCEKAGLIALYEVGGKRFLEMLDFRQSVRAKGSQYPERPKAVSATQLCSTCDADATQMLRTSDADALVVVFGDVDVDVDGGAPRAKTARVSLPAGFAISERVRAWAEEKGHTMLPQRLEHFVGYVKRNGKKYVDWDEAFMGAVREDWAHLNNQVQATKAAPGTVKVAM